MPDEGSFPAQFGTVAIVGVGLLGGSLGMALKARRLARHVVGIGRRLERLDDAVRLGAIDSGVTELRQGVADADLIVLCTTVGHIQEALREVLPLARPAAVVTDVGSTKTAIVAAAGGDPRFVGSHPMAGSERTGVEAAAPRLFQDATWVLTPTDSTDPRTFHQVRALAQQIGASTLVATPEAHDRMVALTSHLPHVLSAALMRQAADARLHSPDLPRVAAGSFADMTRVSASSPDIWRDVCLTNRDAVLAALIVYRRQLDVLEAAVTQNDAAAIEAFFDAAATAKHNWNAF